MSKINQVKAMIYKKYNRECELAKELGWTKQRLNKITTGKKEPDLEEVQALAGKLDKSFEDMAYIFLNMSNQTGDSMTA